MREREREKREDLMRERTRGGEFFADEIAGGDVGNAEEGREAAGVGAFADAGAAEENPLDISVLWIFAAKSGGVVESERRRKTGGLG